MDKSRLLTLLSLCSLLSAPGFAAPGKDNNNAPMLKPGTYVVSETFVSTPNSIFTPFQATFTGRFTFNPHGTGLCSALLCAAGVIPDFPNVSMSGTATNRIPWGPNILGQIGVEEVGDTLTFVNFNGLPGLTSSTSFLDLTLTSPLGGSVTHISTSEADYCAFGAACANSTGTIMVCASAGTNNATCTGSVDIVGHRGQQTSLAHTHSADPSVPEPGTFALFALSLAGLGIARTRRV
jgi:hypothetical protein